MKDELDLSVPQVKGEPSAPNRRFPAALALILLVCVVNLAVVWIRTGANRTNFAGDMAMPTPESRRELARKLEEQGLTEQAAEAWKEYLLGSGPDGAQSAKIWYRIGRLHQNAGRFADALDAYYRSESCAAVEELSAEIGRRTQECLEKLGKFAALRHELAERVGMKPTEDNEGDRVVAEIGPEKITVSGLDRRIEADIERRLSQLSAYVPEEELNSRKESMLKQRSSSEERLRFLRQYVSEEILYRKARESGLGGDPDVRALLDNIERGLLAQKAIERETEDAIRITEDDVRMYYEAHKEDYIRPERAAISHILVADEHTAKKALDRVRAGEDFGELAKELSADEATRDKGGEIDGWAEKNGFIPAIGYSEDARDLIFDTRPGEIATNHVKTARGHHVIKVRERQPESQKPFQEVREEVFRALRSRKEREVQETFLARLRDEYDVVIHHSAFAQEKPKDEGEKE